MKNIETITREELNQIIQQYEKTFDIVRLVDSEHTAVLHFEDEGVIRTEAEPCFMVWNKSERCENCISRGACIQKRRMTKFEYKDNEMYSVTAMPFTVIDGEHEYIVSMELVNYVSDDLFVQIQGNSVEQTAMELLNYKIYKDSLTGVYNRRYFDEKQYLAEMRVKESDRLGFIMVDVDRFKQINDFYGHIKGDELLYQIAQILQNGVRSSDCVIRVGGDEFIIVLLNCSHVFVERKANELKERVSNIKLEWMGGTNPSVSVGASFIDNFTGVQQIAELYNEADQHMYANKSMPVEIKKAMLIVDDIEMNRAILKDYFQDNFEIYEAIDGLDGIRVLKEYPIEVVIADINMPRMNGIDMIREVRKDPQIADAIIFAITDRGEQWELKALEAGADDFINKPFNPELLNHRIEGVLSQNTVFNRISQYQLSFNQNQIPFATVKIMEDSLNYQYVNDAFSQLMNGTPDDFVSGRRGLHFDGFLEFVKDVVATKKRKQIYVHDDATGLYYDIVAYAHDNGFCSFIIMKNNAFRVLKDTESEYENAIMRMSRALLGAVNVYTEIDLNTMQYRQINLQDEQYFNISENGLYGPAFEYMCENEIHPDDVVRVRETLSQEALEEIENDDNGLEEVRVKYRLKNTNPVRLMESRAFFIREKNHRYVVITAENVTKEMVVAEEDIRNSTIYEHIGVGVVVFRYMNETASLIAANKSASDIIGIDSSQLIGKKINSGINLIHPEDVSSVQEATKKIFMPDSTTEFECRIQNVKSKDYIWLLEKTNSTLQDDGSIVIYLCFYDVTEQKKLQEMRESMIIEREAAEQKTEFLANMSHEMRTPMNAILGLTKLTVDLVEDIPEAKEQLRQIEDSSEYLLGVINDILDMSKISSGKVELHREWTLQKNIVLPVIQMIEPRMNEKQITFEYDHRLLNIQGFEALLDEQKVKQVLMNVLSNACKFTKEGGTVKFSGSSKGVNRETNMAILQFQIEDNGCGMSDEFLSKIFSPFEQERTDDNFEIPGTGLGLAVSHAIVRACGGEISVKSKLGEGSIFTISIPAKFRKSNGKVEPKEVEDKQSVIQKLNGKRVLLAEDHPLNAVIAIRLLEKMGIIATHVTDGKEAVNLFAKSEPGTFDAILMDIRMPNMDGLTATKAIRKINSEYAKSVPIIAMTANAYEDDYKKSIEAGMNDHLSKPIEPDLMYETLAKYFSE